MRVRDTLLANIIRVHLEWSLMHDALSLQALALVELYAADLFSKGLRQGVGLALAQEHRF